MTTNMCSANGKASIQDICLQESAIFAAYAVGPKEGEEISKAIFQGRAYTSPYIKKDQNQAWYHKIWLWMKGYSRIGSTNDYALGVKRGVKNLTNQLKLKSSMTHSVHQRVRDAVRNALLIGNSANGSIRDFLPKKTNRLTQWTISVLNGLKGGALDRLARALLSKIEKKDPVLQRLSSYKKIRIDKKAKEDQIQQEFSLITDDISLTEENGCAIASCLGQRDYMEDRFLTGSISIDQKRAPFFAVFDGHGGAAAADFLEKNLQKNLEILFAQFLPKESHMDLAAMENACTMIGVKLHEEFCKVRDSQIRDRMPALETMAKNMKKIIDNNGAENASESEILNKVGDILINLPKEHPLIQLQTYCMKIEYRCASSANEPLQIEWKNANIDLFPFGGTTMSLVIVLNGYGFCINIGDSRALLVTDSAIEQLTQDAFPSDPSFKKSVEKRGGVVEDNRVYGILATARAIGDDQIEGISPRPKVTCFPVQKEMKLIIGSDGLFETLKSQEVGKLVQQNKTWSNQDLSYELLKEAYATGSSDNITAMVASLSLDADLFHAK
ncbi:MAG: PP2C family protein-serine/threonine phosphatase [Chlamydia sp.]